MARRGGEIVGMLPLCSIARPFGKARWVSLPFCDLGGPLAVDAEVAEALAARARLGLKEAGAAGLALRCSLPAGSDEAGLEGRKVRMLLGLPDSAAALMQSYPPKLRSQVRKAEKNGLTSEVADGAAAVADFYDVYSRNMRRLGSPPHSRAWFDAIYRHYSAAGDMFIVIVRHEGKAVGAGWVLTCGDKAVIPWASTLADYNPLAPNMLLYWAIQSRLCEIGVRQFDFGRSTFGEGTYKFKKQWGAVPAALDWREWDAQGVAHPAPPITAPGAKGGAVSNLRPLVESTWQKLPLAVTNSLGPRLRRYITL
ncbi:GNAT family N-acetyltransferase [Massilia sp. Se16.2.3]|uniref:GNAT family N-acetyltransferase n=1 Tax=Massilia sp. Se16.2.3 TaxID=2709303 RepID=UPI0016006C6C|nr:GNAT family N-acetyltransferase [Massilia sp. Se16.2.3]QNA98075.1 GNAT family N-acetyltransferase [Massilia sp. Se16.2.3]